MAISFMTDSAEGHPSRFCSDLPIFVIPVEAKPFHIPSQGREGRERHPRLGMDALSCTERTTAELN